MLVTQTARKLKLAVIIFLVAGLFLNLSVADKARAAEDSQFFPETGKTVSGKFLQYWRTNGGLPVYGYPITEAQMEVDPETGKTFLIQWFERNRFEYHPENAGTRYEILLGLLGKDLKREALIADQEFVPAIPLTDPATKPDVQIYFNETGHNLQGLFYKYWHENGGLERFGYPISEVYEATDPETGWSYPTQWFERARFEYHRENDPPYDVLLGLLGKQLKNPPAISERIWAVGASSQSVYMPNAIGLDSNKNIFVIDNRQRVLKYNSSRQLVNIFGQFDTSFYINKVRTDSFNNIYILNRSRSLAKYSPSLQLLKEFPNSQVQIGRHFAVDGDGFIYSTYKGTFFKYDQTGKLEFKLEVNDTNKDWLGKASAIALDSQKNIYLTVNTEDSSSIAKIIKLDNQGKYLSSFKVEGYPSLETTLLNLDSQGNIYLLPIDQNYLLKFAKAGTFEKLELGYKINDFAFDEQGNLYTTSDDSILRKRSPQGEITKWGSIGESTNLVQANYDYNIRQPAGLVTDKDGNVYVTDYFNSAIKKFNSKGQLLTSWGKPGSGKQASELSFEQVAALAIDEQGFIYIADDYRVQKFTNTGQFVDIWGPVGAKAENALKAKSLAIDPRGYVYLGDVDKISKYDMDAKLLASWPINTDKESAKGYLQRISLDKQGNVYALVTFFSSFNQTGIRIQKYDASGQLLLTFDAGYQSPSSSFTVTPTGISVDEQGNIYISRDEYPHTPDTEITKCTFEGKNCTEVVGNSRQGAGLKHPAAVTVVNQNLIYVFDLHLGLQKFRLP